LICQDGSPQKHVTHEPRKFSGSFFATIGICL
jgi:hypothetical protein